MNQNYEPLWEVSEAKNRSDLCTFGSSWQELDFNLAAEKAFVAPVGGWGASISRSGQVPWKGQDGPDDSERRVQSL